MPFFFVLCRMMIPAALSSRFFCKTASRRASSNCRSRAFRFAFFPCVFASRARASESISFSEEKKQTRQ
jgi:hypothetical protein